jgi:hypothetical protein
MQTDSGFEMSAVRNLAWNWAGPKSVCKCGHTGDCSVRDTGGQHDGPQGHGRCRECSCDHFTWRRWTLTFGDALRKVIKGVRS